MSKLSRRDALKLSLLTGAMPFVRHGDLPRLLSDRLRLGIIGVGNRARPTLLPWGMNTWLPCVMWMTVT